MRFYCDPKEFEEFCAEKIFPHRHRFLQWAAERRYIVTLAVKSLDFASEIPVFLWQLALFGLLVWKFETDISPQKMPAPSNNTPLYPQNWRNQLIFSWETYAVMLLFVWIIMRAYYRQARGALMPDHNEQPSTQVMERQYIELLHKFFIHKNQNALARVALIPRNDDEYSYARITHYNMMQYYIKKNQPKVADAIFKAISIHVPLIISKGRQDQFSQDLVGQLMTMRNDLRDYRQSKKPLEEAVALLRSLLIDPVSLWKANPANARLILADRGTTLADIFKIPSDIDRTDRQEYSAMNKQAFNRLKSLEQVRLLHILLCAEQVSLVLSLVYDNPEIKVRRFSVKEEHDTVIQIDDKPLYSLNELFKKFIDNFGSLDPELLAEQLYFLTGMENTKAQKMMRELFTSRSSLAAKILVCLVQYALVGGSAANLDPILQAQNLFYNVNDPAKALDIFNKIQGDLNSMDDINAHYAALLLGVGRSEEAVLLMRALLSTEDPEIIYTTTAEWMTDYDLLNKKLFMKSNQKLLRRFYVTYFSDGAIEAFLAKFPEELEKINVEMQRFKIVVQVISTLTRVVVEKNEPLLDGKLLYIFQKCSSDFTWTKILFNMSYDIETLDRLTEVICRKIQTSDEFKRGGYDFLDSFNITLDKIRENKKNELKKLISIFSFWVMESPGKNDLMNKGFHLLLFDKNAPFECSLEERRKTRLYLLSILISALLLKADKFEFFQWVNEIIRVALQSEDFLNTISELLAAMQEPFSDLEIPCTPLAVYFRVAAAYFQQANSLRKEGRRFSEKFQNIKPQNKQLVNLQEKQENIRKSYVEVANIWKQGLQLFNVSLGQMTELEQNDCAVCLGQLFALYQDVGGETQGIHEAIYDALYHALQQPMSPSALMLFSHEMRRTFKKRVDSYYEKTMDSKNGPYGQFINDMRQYLLIGRQEAKNTVGAVINTVVACLMQAHYAHYRKLAGGVDFISLQQKRQHKENIINVLRELLLILNLDSGLVMSIDDIPALSSCYHRVGFDIEDLIAMCHLLDSANDLRVEGFDYAKN